MGLAENRPSISDRAAGLLIRLPDLPDANRSYPVNIPLTHRFLIRRCSAYLPSDAPPAARLRSARSLPPVGHRSPVGRRLPAYPALTCRPGLSGSASSGFGPFAVPCSLPA